MSDKTLSGVSHTASGIDKNSLRNSRLKFAKCRGNRYPIFKSGKNHHCTSAINVNGTILKGYWIAHERAASG